MRNPFQSQDLVRSHSEEQGNVGIDPGEWPLRERRQEVLVVEAVAQRAVDQLRRQPYLLRGHPRGEVLQQYGSEGPFPLHAPQQAERGLSGGFRSRHGPMVSSPAAVQTSWKSSL